MLNELTLKNARIVTSTEVVEGSVHIRGGVIADIQSGQIVSANAIDFEGDYLIPGLIDLHTDNVERHLRPRRDADWPVLAALMAHDAEMTAVGITTIFDSLYVGERNIEPRNSAMLKPSICALKTGRQKQMFRGDHFLHLRAETSKEQMTETFASVFPEPSVLIVSLMDHTPGQRQFSDPNRIGGRFGGGDDRDHTVPLEKMDQYLKTVLERQERVAGPNRIKLLSLLEGHSITLASHDDTTVEHVE